MPLLLPALPSIVVVWLLAAAVLDGAAIDVASAFGAVARHERGRASRRRRECAVAAFVAAIGAGDLTGAEEAAERAFHEGAR